MVFLQELPRPNPLSSRNKRSIAMAAALATATGFIVIVPRSATVAGWLCSLVILLLSTRTTTATQDFQVRLWSFASTRTIQLAMALVAWILIVALFWSPADGAIRVAAYCASLIMILCFAAHRISSLSRHDILFIVESAWVVFIIATGIVLLDAATNQEWKRALLTSAGLSMEIIFTPRFIFQSADGQITGLHYSILTRNAFAIALLLCPMLLTIRSILSKRWQRPVTIILIGLVTATIFVLPQEAAKLALCVAIFVFALAWFAPRVTLVTVAVSWVVLCLFAVPIAKLPDTIGISSNPSFTHSTRERAKIWHRIADKASEKPIAGVGITSTFEMGMKGAFGIRDDARKEFQPSHPHNVFLETRFELGSIGSLLLAAFGCSLVYAMANLSRETLAFSLATFSSSAVILATTYSIWSESYAGSLGFVLLCTLFAIRASETRPITPSR